ncbi:DUF2169 domain-containing protein [Bradyrhizobium yuanmingense]|uniref:DUF2169 domain-containing protein n=1 Tax=Bradyrhizobium yuanmingense TaxID=108015 RepID=UPI0021A88B3F|nr:DUF2169 domain-containing protein [Bradyrhizobium sp. CB1024]UWU82850.1 DUF2169 domain-containing protein [Bradyrhizobium sp. CB1024]
MAGFMPVPVKPRTLALSTKCERRPPGTSLISAFAVFNLADSHPNRLQGEQELWVMAAKELPPGISLHAGMLKPQTEVLIGGHAAEPEGRSDNNVHLDLGIHRTVPRATAKARAHRHTSLASMPAFRHKQRTIR